MRVLSLSGGGFQGLFTALCLARLEESAEARLRHKFDAFAGTSVGGLIAAAGAVGLPMTELIRVFRDEGPKIFSDRPAPTTRTAAVRDLMRYLNHAKYDGEHLGRVVRAYCGDRRLGDLDRPLLLTAVRVADGEPVLFTTASHPDALLREVVMATTAAPMIFPPVRVGGALHADGAIFANCPDALALSFARGSLRARDVEMLSVGAMNRSPPLSEPDAENMGAVGWLSENRIFRTLISAQTIMTERTLVAELGDAYRRVDADPGGYERRVVGLDVADRAAMTEIRRAAEHCYPDMDAWARRGEDPSPLLS